MAGETIISEAAYERARAYIFQEYCRTYEKVRGATALEGRVIKEADELAAFCLHADTRTICIIAVSFAEDCLKRNFIDKWNISGSANEERFFGTSGPLSTFSQRSLIANSLGWITEGELKEFDSLRKIRNLFAHNHTVHSLKDSRMAKHCDKLVKREETWNDDKFPEYAPAFRDTSLEHRLKMRLFFSGNVYRRCLYVSLEAACFQSAC